MMEYREQRSFIPEKRNEIVPRPVDREWAEIESIPTWPPFPRGKKRGGRLETLHFPDVRKNRRKGLSVGDSVPGPRFLRPGEGGPQSPDGTGKQLENRRFPQGRKTNPPASRTCRRMKKQSGKFPVLKGAFYRLAGPVHDSLVAHIPAAAQGRVQGNQRAGMLVIIL